MSRRREPWCITGEHRWGPAFRCPGTRASSCWRRGPRSRGSEAEAALRHGARALGLDAGLVTRVQGPARTLDTREHRPSHPRPARKHGPQDRSPAGVRRPRCTAPGPDPEGASLTTAPLLSSAHPGSTYLRDNAKAGRLRRATLTHRAAMTATRAVLHVPDMRGSHWPAPSRARQFAQTLCLLPRPTTSSQPVRDRFSSDGRTVVTNNVGHGSGRGLGTSEASEGEEVKVEESSGRRLTVSGAWSRKEPMKRKQRGARWESEVRQFGARATRQ